MDEAFGLNSDRLNGEDTKECLICLTERKDTLARPCKHVTLCNACAKVVMLGDKKCPPVPLDYRGNLASSDR